MSSFNEIFDFSKIKYFKVKKYYRLNTTTFYQIKTLASSIKYNIYFIIDEIFYKEILYSFYI